MSSGLYNTHKADFDTHFDPKRVKAYGDTMNDGKVQFSFTLPVKNDERGVEAARQLVRKMGVDEPNVACAKTLDKEFTFFVVYGSVSHSVDYENIHVVTVEEETMSMEETNEYIKEHFGRKIVMVGASTGTDAHTVGIDAIMNRKGFAGHYGLERYEMVEAINMGAQVPNEDFLKKALEVNADVLLISQTVTQKDIHIQNLTEFIELLEAGEYDFYRVNFPNGDMVGHTGSLEATICAMEALDLQLGRILPVIDRLHGVAVITADHGNADEMAEIDKKTGKPKLNADGSFKAKTSHTLNPVPCFIYDATGQGRISVKEDRGTFGLSNIAATVAELLGRKAPGMWDESLININ